jgi:hypothetical protein
MDLSNLTEMISITNVCTNYTSVLNELLRNYSLEIFFLPVFYENYFAIYIFYISIIKETIIILQVHIYV